jgi:flagellin
MRLRTNITSLGAQRKIGDHSRKVEDSQRKLSSGKRITRASDDAAGLSISNKMNASLRSKKQAIRNANDAISYVQVAESGIGEISNMIVRMRELAVQASTATNSDAQRQMLDMEVHQLKKEVNRIAEVTQINGHQLLQGNDKSFDIQVDSGDGTSDRVKINMKDLAQDANSLGIFDVNLTSRRQAQFALAKLDYAQQSVSKSRAKLGSYQNRFNSTIRNLSSSTENIASAKSQINDVDVAKETATSLSSGLKLKTAIAASKISNQHATSYLKLLK